MATVTINISENNKCRKCGRGWAVNDTGLCMSCINKGIKRGGYDHILKRENKKTVFEKMGDIAGTQGEKP